MKTIGRLIEWARQQLPCKEFPEQEEEIVRILKHVFDIERYEVLTRSRDEVSFQKKAEFTDIVHERKTHKPLAYILGYVPFYQDVFPVSPQTLIPRFDTECLLEEAKFLFPEHPGSILDIATGTGAIALSLRRLFPNAEITALDIVSEPFRNSCRSLGIDNVYFERMDFLNKRNWKCFSGRKFDLIISNPPYLSQSDIENLDSQVKNFEPKRALYAGNQGLAFYAHIRDFCREYLAANGCCLLEIDYKWRSVADLFSEEFYVLAPIKDLNGLERCLVVKKLF